MKYTVAFVCYLSRRGNQYQHAFVFKTGQRVRLSEDLKLPSGEVGLDRELHGSLFEIKFFPTKEKAMANARLYCDEPFIHVLK